MGTSLARITWKRYDKNLTFYLRVNSKVLGDYCGGPRTKERFDELLSSLLRHHKPEEGIHSRMGGEETRDFGEVQMRRMRCRERIMEIRGSL